MTKIKMQKLTPQEWNLKTSIIVKRYGGQKAEQLQFFNEMIESRTLKYKIKRFLRRQGLIK